MVLEGVLPLATYLCQTVTGPRCGSAKGRGSDQG
jgi:hypothetical protein